MVNSTQKVLWPKIRSIGFATFTAIPKVDF